MNDLQVALIAAGAAAVAGVWGYNKWQEARQRKLAERIFRGEQADTLLKPDDAVAGEPAPEMSVDETPLEPYVAERREPVLPDDSVLPVEPAVPITIEPAADITVELPPLPAQLADPIADCIVRIDFAAPVAAAELWAAQSPWAANIGKPLSWLGFDQAMGDWKKLGAEDGGHYRVVQAALQLANREGAVTEVELAAFLDGVWALADQCSGVTGIPDRADVLATAQNLDEFCAGVDLQLGVKIVGANEPLSGLRLKELAVKAGLRLLADGTFHALDADGMTRFTVANIGTEGFAEATLASLETHGLTLVMDVPRVPDGTAAFDALIALARAFSEALGGVLVDSQGSLLSDDMIVSIRNRVAQIQTMMARHQIVAGSVRALRLFS